MAKSINKIKSKQSPQERDKQSGIVVRNTGSNYEVLLDSDDKILCKIKGTFRLKGIRTTNPVSVGDRVDVIINPDNTAYIVAIAPRKNYIIRRASNLSKEASILAANVDQACLVVTLKHPETSTTFIDRFLATCEAYQVPAIIVINKIDLLQSDPDDIELLDAVTYLYESIGYKVIALSAETGIRLDELRAALADKITLIAGNSGVGKSTLINKLIPGLELKTGEISDAHDTGMHTTTFSEMFHIPDSKGWIIDTPGVRGFGTLEFNEYEVSHYFPEIFKISKECRYGNCTHTHEPHCAVMEALANQQIAQSRYNSYLSILEDANPDKYRKPF